MEHVHCSVCKDKHFFWYFPTIKAKKWIFRRYTAYNSKSFCNFALFIPTSSGELGGTATYWKASLTLCFWLSETSTIQINQSRATAEVNATGVVYTPGVCRGLTMPSRTLFGVHYILTGVGIQTLFVHWLGCGRPQIAGRAGEDTPLFVCRH